MKFHFMIHADKKSAGKWQDLPLPFPEEETAIMTKDRDLGGVSQIPDYLRGSVFKT